MSDPNLEGVVPHLYDAIFASFEEDEAIASGTTACDPSSSLQQAVEPLQPPLPVVSDGQPSLSSLQNEMRQLRELVKDHITETTKVLAFLSTKIRESRTTPNLGIQVGLHDQRILQVERSVTTQRSLQARLDEWDNGEVDKRLQRLVEHTLRNGSDIPDSQLLDVPSWGLAMGSSTNPVQKHLLERLEKRFTAPFRQSMDPGFIVPDQRAVNIQLQFIKVSLQTSKELAVECLTGCVTILLEIEVKHLHGLGASKVFTSHLQRAANGNDDQKEALKAVGSYVRDQALLNTAAKNGGQGTGRSGNQGGHGQRGRGGNRGGRGANSTAER
jgi:hypothetical protein